MTLKLCSSPCCQFQNSAPEISYEYGLYDCLDIQQVDDKRLSVILTASFYALKFQQPIKKIDLETKKQVRPTHGIVRKSHKTQTAIRHQEDNYHRPPDKSAYWKTSFFIFHPKHMLWVHKRTVSMHMIKLMGKKTIAILR